MLHYHKKPQEYCECVGNLMYVSPCCTVHEASKSVVDGCVSMLVSDVLYVLATWFMLVSVVLHVDSVQT